MMPNSSPNKPLWHASVFLAERQRFELWCRIAATIRFPAGALRPLGHLSKLIAAGVLLRQRISGLPVPPRPSRVPPRIHSLADGRFQANGPAANLAASERIRTLVAFPPIRFQNGAVRPLRQLAIIGAGPLAVLRRVARANSAPPWLFGKSLPAPSGFSKARLSPPSGGVRGWQPRSFATACNSWWR